MSSPKDFETFEEYKDTLPKEPTDPNSKKEYIVGCFTPDDWKYIHEVLLEDGTLEDNIPKQTIDCVDDYKHSPIRGRYLLNDTEAEQLRNHEKVDYVNINVAKYPGTYLQDPSTFREFDKEFRYASTVKCVRDIQGYGNNNYIPSNPGSSLKNRASFQLNRHMQQADPFQGNDNQLIENRIQQYGTGEGVDVIVCDEDAWFGHIEFQNNLGGPQNYTGGNPLPGNGTCDLIDLVLESPYYLDPDWFNGDASRRESRWDGTTVPTDAAARAWWSTERANYVGHGYTIKITDAGNSSNFKTFTITDNDGVIFFSGVTNRQGFSYNNTPVASGGTLPSTGAVTIEFTRTGSGTWNGAASYGPFSYNLTSGDTNPASGTINLFDNNTIYLNRVDSNGTDRSSVFNSSAPFNIDAVSAVTNGTRSAKFVGTNVPGGIATGNDDFGTLVIPAGYTRANSNGTNTAYKTGFGFHGTPCASQCYGRQYGWAYNANKFYLNLYGTNDIGWETGYDMIKIFHQIKPSNATYGNQNPTITSNSYGFRQTPLNSGYYYYQQDGTGSGGVFYSVSNWTSGTQPEFMTNMYQTAIRHEMQSNSLLTAGNEMIAAGVIFVGSSGNTNQKLVKADHSDYNNYYSSSNNTALSSSTFSLGGYPYRRTINNQGFPCQIGATGSGTSKVYNTICVGALDDNFRGGSTGNEQKVIYSNKGNLIDCYAAADDTLAACDNRSGGRINRNDAYYTIGSTQSAESEDRKFDGTSSACPIACGIIATKLQYNRTWTVSNVKNWLQNNVGTMPSTNFYYGTEETSATSTGWSDQNAVHDSAPVIIWDALTGGEPASANNKLSLFGGDFSLSGNLQIT